MASEEPSSIVFVGAATLDAIALVDHFPAPDERLLAREMTYAGGGPAATAAVAACRLGVHSAFVGAVGADDEGRQIIASLTDEGVDVSGVQMVPGRRSGASVVVVDADRGTRAICTRPVPRLTLDHLRGAETLLTQTSWVHVDHLGWDPIHAWLEAASSQTPPRLSVDGGNPIAGFTPEGVDLYVPTLDTLVGTYGERAEEDLVRAALEAGADAVVATRGADGCVAATADGSYLEVAGHEVPVRSTLGAGDVFHGALLAAIVRDLPLLECLRYANVAAALSCRGLDGRSRIPSHEEVLWTRRPRPPVAEHLLPFVADRPLAPTADRTVPAAP